MNTLNAGEGKVSKIGPYQAKISGNAVAGLVIEFQQEFWDVYGYDVMASPLCAVGPLQTMIGLAIHKGLLVAPDAYVPMPKCTSWLGHKFEARYSEVAGQNTASIIEAIGHGTASTEVNVPFYHVYVHDVCTRCGHIVNRPAPKDPNQ